MGGSGIQFSLDIEKLKGKLVCVISVVPSETPIFFQNKEYYVRKGTQNQSLNPKETVEYINVRYPNFKLNQEKTKKKQETEIRDFVKDIREGNYEAVLNKFNNREYLNLFKNLFTKIDKDLGRLILYSDSFILAIGVVKIYALQPIHKDLYPDWKEKSLAEMIEVWSKDLFDRASQVLKLDIDYSRN